MNKERETIRYVFDIPSHMNSEFGRLQKAILDELDFLYLNEVVSKEKWNKIRNVILTNTNSVQRNMVLLVVELQNRIKELENGREMA